MTAISSPGGDGVSTRSRAIRAPPALSLDEQRSIERQVRTAALAAARNNIASGDLDRIVSLATDDFTLGAPARSMADRITLAVSLAEAVEKTHAPFNWLSATPQQIEAYRAAMGLLGHHHLAGLTNLASNGGGGGASGGSGATRASGETSAVTSTAYDHALNSSERSVFNSLAKQYGAGAANGAIGFAHQIGAPVDLARKFIKLDESNRGELHHFVDGIRNDPNLTPEQRKQKIEAFRKAHPKIGRTLTNDDVERIIRNDVKQKVKPGNESSVHTKSQSERTIENRQIGAEGPVEKNRRNIAAQVNADPTNGQSDEDKALAFLHARSTQNSAGRPNPSHDQSGGGSASQRDASLHPSTQTKSPPATTKVNGDEKTDARHARRAVPTNPVV
jgi:hypothetical protein